jgi:hypothetical protein
VIYWKDFLLDNEIGPMLELPESEVNSDCEIKVVRSSAWDKQGRRKRLGSPDIMDDVYGKKNEASGASIQETGQEQRPARMVGLSSSDSAETGRDAGRGNRVQVLRQREEA